MDPSQDCLSHARLPWIHQHVQIAPPIFRVFWGCSSVATLIVFVISFLSIRQHFLIGEELRRAKGLVFLPRHARLHIQILALFPILSFTSWLSLFIVRQALLLELLAYLYNMACLFWFFELLIELMGGPERALVLLRKEPPFKIYQVPPLMCWNIFARRKRFDLTELRLTRALLCQYAVMGPLIAVTDALNESYLNILHYLRILVTLLCMWGLVMVFRASRLLLAEFRTPYKYMAVQITVFLVNFTSLVLGYFVPPYDEMYDAGVMGEAWVHFVFCMAMLPLGVLAVHSYRAEELWLREEKLNTTLWSVDFSDVPDGTADEGVEERDYGKSSKKQSKRLRKFLEQKRDGQRTDYSPRDDCVSTCGIEGGGGGSEFLEQCTPSTEAEDFSARRLGAGGRDLPLRACHRTDAAGSDFDRTQHLRPHPFPSYPTPSADHRDAELPRSRCTAAYPADSPPLAPEGSPREQKRKAGRGASSADKRGVAVSFQLSPNHHTEAMNNINNRNNHQQHQQHPTLPPPMPQHPTPPLTQSCVPSPPPPRSSPSLINRGLSTSSSHNFGWTSPRRRTPPIRASSSSFSSQGEDLRCFHDHQMSPLPPQHSSLPASLEIRPARQPLRDPPPSPLTITAADGTAPPQTLPPPLSSPPWDPPISPCRAACV